MNRTLVTIGIAVAIAVSVVAKPTSAGEEPTVNTSIGDEVPLTTADLDQITAQVLRKNPLLSSSSGIKFAAAQRSVRSVEIADIIYHPHTETAGLKEAFQVQCLRQVNGETWTCDNADIRAYLKLESQEFEVRVRDGFSSDEALALIAATRQFLKSSEIDGSERADTAVMVWRFGGRVLISWGSPEGYQELILEARLIDGGNSTRSEDWQADVYRPPN